MSEEIIIEAGRHELNYWRDLWRYRELFRVLAWRDLAVRYKQTVIGAAWAVIRPLLTMVVFTVALGFGDLDNLNGLGAYLVGILLLWWGVVQSALGRKCH